MHLAKQIYRGTMSWRDRPDAYIEGARRPQCDTVFEMPTNADLAKDIKALSDKVGPLAERVDNHIMFFKVIVGFAVAWLTTLSGFYVIMSNKVSEVGKTQADTTSRIVAGLLTQHANSREEVAQNVSAAGVMLNTARIGTVKPDPQVVNSVAKDLDEAQEKYPDLPEVWRTTGDFINYKYATYLQDHAKADIHGAYSMSCESVAKTRIGSVFNNCNMDLEGIVSDHAIFYKCVIRYRGGVISIKHLDFVDCVFDFKVNTVPPAQGTRVMRQLAEASNTSKVSVSS